MDVKQKEGIAIAWYQEFWKGSIQCDCGYGSKIYKISSDADAEKKLHLEILLKFRVDAMLSTCLLSTHCFKIHLRIVIDYWKWVLCKIAIDHI